MQKIIFLLFFLSLNFLSLSQLLFSSNQLIEPYFGFPNLGHLSYTFTIDTLNQKNREFSGIAPSGLRYSFMLNEDISIGVDVMYNRINESYTTTETNFLNNEWVNLDYEIIESSQRVRIQARIDFHFPFSYDMSDSYLGIGFGTNQKWKKTTRNGSVTEKVSGDEAVLFPFSLRVCYGYRYYFNYNWGIQGEVGLGGPLLSLGLSYKI